MAGLAGILGASLFGGGLANAISGSNSNSGAQNSAYSSGGSIQGGSSSSGSINNAWSNTAGIQASANSAEQAEKANQMQLEMLREAQRFNAEEAKKQRDWQENMANTVYTRSVKNMIEAGINPILAANLGISAGNVSSGASASVGTPSAFMGQSFAEQNSASTGSSFGNSSEYGSSWNESQSHGSEWSNSHSGLAEGLKQMGAISDAAMANIASSEALKYAMENFGDGRNKVDSWSKDVQKPLENLTDYFKNMDNSKYDFENSHGTGGSGHKFN